jgi:hypothetical protein
VNRTKLEKELFETRALVKAMLRAIENLGCHRYARIGSRIYYLRYKKRWDRIKKECS